MSEASFRGTMTGSRIVNRLTPPSRAFWDEHGTFTGRGKGRAGKRAAQKGGKLLTKSYLNWRAKQFGKRRAVEAAARTAAKFGWEAFSPASKAILAAELIDAGLTITELLIAGGLWDAWKMDGKYSYSQNTQLGGYAISGLDLCAGNCLQPVSRTYPAGNVGFHEGGNGFCIIAANAPPSTCNYNCPVPAQAPCSPTSWPTVTDNALEWNIGQTVVGVIIVHYTDLKCIIGHDCVWQILRGTVDSVTWTGDVSDGKFRMPKVRPLTFTPTVTPGTSAIVESMVLPPSLPRPDPTLKPYQIPAVELDTLNRYGNHNGRHNRVPPKGGERERKGRVGLRRALKIAANIYGEATEVKDFVDAIHGALPKKYQVKGGVIAKSKAIYDHIDSLDLGKMGYNLALNHYSDKAIGKLYSYGKKAPYGSQLGHPLHNPVW